MSTDYLEVNRESWNRRLESHVASEFYNVPEFLVGKCSLKSIELELLGDINNQRILHLQCHFGQDTISLSRRGAIVTGVDFAEDCINYAKAMADELNENVSFICCDVYSVPETINEQFDIVFTSYGTIGWLPDIDKWAKTIAHCLRPGGKLVFVEFHPVIWMFDDDFQHVHYNYFNAEPIIETIEGTYADRNIKNSYQSITWNHSLSEVIKALLSNGIQLIQFDEYDYSPYYCLKHLEKIDESVYRLKHLQDRIPMVYSIVGRKS